MKEFYLIPESYHVYISKLRIFKISIIAFIFFIAVSGIAYGAIEVAKKTTSKRIEKLKLISEVTRQQQQAFDELQIVKNDLDSKWNLLNGLRSAPPPENLLYAIDSALIDIDVWFTNLRFDRVEQAIQKEESVDTGYFIIVNPEGGQTSLSIGTQMTISGGAHNHSTLSVFVKNLLAQPIILNAKVLETSTTNRNNQKHINYVLEIVVNTREHA